MMGSLCVGIAMMHTNQGGLNKAKVLAYLQRQLEDLIISVTWGELKQEIIFKGDMQWKN